MAVNEVLIPETNHKLLAGQHFGIMSTIRHCDGLLSSNPVGFVWDGEHIRVSSLKSRMKYKNLLADARIGFCVMSAKNPMEYLEVRGIGELEDDNDRAFFRQQFIAGAGEEPPEDIDGPGEERIIITVRPQQVSSPQLYGGRFDDNQQDK